MSEPVTAKSQLRSEIRACLAAMSAEMIQSSSMAIVKHIAAAKDLLSGINTIGLYSAIHQEISLSALHQLLPEKKFVYPLCQPGNQLTFHLVPESKQLLANSMQILEPQPSVHPEINITEIDLIICPGLAFGMDGSRLGRGQGYYDRALEHFKGLKLGAAFEKQIKASVPHAPHDAMMNYLVSEKGLFTTTPLQE